MPDGNPIGGLYPQPQQGQQSILNQNPFALIGGLNALQFNQREQAKFNASKAAGSAFQNALNPDGTLDQGKLVSGLKNPDAALAAPESVSTMLAQRGQMISNSTGQFNLSSGQSDYAVKVLGPLINNPNVTKADIAGVLPNLVRAGVPAQIAQGWYAGLPNDPKGLRAALGNINAIAMGPGGAAARVSGPPGADLAPTTTSAADAAATGPMATGAGPSVVASNTAYNTDQQASAGIQAGVQPLLKALPLIKQLDASDFGPGSVEYSQLKSLLTTAGVIPEGSGDVDLRQEANKYLHMYAGQARGAERSDQGLAQATSSNPSLDLTRGANSSLIQNQVAMDRMSGALTNAYDAMNPSDKAKGGYLGFKSKFYQENDPRAFSFDIMSPDERRKVVDSLGEQDSPAFKKFEKSYELAKKVGVITPPQGASDGQQ